MAKRRPDKKLDFQGNHFGKQECVFPVVIWSEFRMGPILILILRAPKIEQFFQLMTTKTSRKQVLQT